MPIPAERAAALQRARHESDRQIALLADSLSRDHCSHCSSELGTVSALQVDLAAARLNVDQLARLARAQRGDHALQDAGNRMIAIIPEFLQTNSSPSNVRAAVSSSCAP
ncbi:hypothetical protein [Paraburkholderia phenazinium]|uniref:Uncharacterized protein n=1 Tax=Paraburkholderia phenazinium TaxID=60549 RepID=A0A1G8K790_9BURK|nr:hypothetical protein [Paraburkholderia phenazinium]SDI39227.1 hypothetical protein SAMN05216466_1229 [Paraburkholderia phenazinium]